MFYEDPFHSRCWGLRGISLPLLDEFEGGGCPYPHTLSPSFAIRLFVSLLGKKRLSFPEE